MSKYPCGICTIGVKHKGILCTGSCNKWFHSKCLNWSDKKFKNLLQHDIESWKCQACYSNKDTLETNVKNQTNNTNCAEVSYKDLPTLSPDIEEINKKLENYGTVEEIDLETSLTLAAEFGNTLLTENASLQEKIHKLTLTNSKLLLKIKKLENLNNENNLEEQIEELIREKKAS